MPSTRQRMNLNAIALTALVSLSAAVVAEPTVADPTCGLSTPLRFATFNVFLNRPEQGQLQRDLENSDAQARKVAEIIAHIRPDV